MDLVPQWAVGIAVILFAYAAAQIVVVKMRASTRKLPAQEQDLSELRQLIEATQNRVGELEERLDFTERLLAQQREPDRLEPPHDQ